MPARVAFYESLAEAILPVFKLERRTRVIWNVRECESDLHGVHRTRDFGITLWRGKSDVSDVCLSWHGHSPTSGYGYISCVHVCQLPYKEVNVANFYFIYSCFSSQLTIHTFVVQALSEDNGVTWTLGYNVETEGGEVKEVKSSPTVCTCSTASLCVLITMTIVQLFANCTCQVMGQSGELQHEW